MSTNANHIDPSGRRGPSGSSGSRGPGGPIGPTGPNGRTGPANPSSFATPSYRGLPTLAGLASLEEAMVPGLSVDACVARLKVYHYAWKRLHQIFIARITAEPIYELKMAFSHHAYLCAEQVAALRRRVGEMREPPLGLEQVPDEALAIGFDEILAAPTTEALLVGLYRVAVPALRDAHARHIQDTNPLADAPSVRLCRFARLDLDDIAAYGERACAALVDDARREEGEKGGAGERRGAQQEPLDHWIALLRACFRGTLLPASDDRANATAGSHAGAAAVSRSSVRSASGTGAGTGGKDASRAGSHEPSVVGVGAAVPARRFSATPYVFDKVPRRDVRFTDPYNMGVNAEAFLYDASLPPWPKVLMMYYKRLREIDVPEMMASIIAETTDKPWAYSLDMTRQLWDEARHAMMGEVGFASLGIDWSALVRINFTWSLGLNTQLTALERHAVLYFIEQGLMPKTGKRFEWETADAAGVPLARTMQDYDWADEVLHARIGREWYVTAMPSQVEALKYGDRCWSKVLIDWQAWKTRGLTDHTNWWPALYRAACDRWQIEPDPAVLAWSHTYETTRADLRSVTGSA